MALSAEEAAWLTRHGYPTVGELEGLHGHDRQMLEAAMRERGDAKAAALVGHLRAEEGDLIGASAAFSRGASLGSLYAREQLAIVDLQRATGLPLDGMAQTHDQAQLAVFAGEMTVAKMLGDHRASHYIEKYAGSLDSSKYADDVLRHAEEFMRQYADDANVRGVVATGPDPRPNAAAWEQLESHPDRTILVYTRSNTWP